MLRFLFLNTLLRQFFVTTVINGSSYVDESMLNGEPLPAFKDQGCQVVTGSINHHGSFRLCAEKVGTDTLLAQIIRLVQDAQGSKAPVQKLADKIASIFVPVIMGIALLSFVLWVLFGLMEMIAPKVYFTASKNTPNIPWPLQ